MPRAIPHAAATRAAVEAALLQGDEPMSAIARRLGIAYGTVRDWNRAGGLRMSVRRTPGSEPLRGLAAVRAGARDLPDLRAALREHAGRQIAAMDARLARMEDAADSGRTLRDLAGLKRLLDEMEESPAERGAPRREQAGKETVLTVAQLRLPFSLYLEACLAALPGADASVDGLSARLAEIVRLATEDRDGYWHRSRALIVAAIEAGVLPADSPRPGGM